MPNCARAGIETHGGHHGDQNDPGKSNGRGARVDGHQIIEPDEASQYGHHEDVDHRPTSHKFGHAIKLELAKGRTDPATLHHVAEPQQCQYLHQGHHHAGEEDHRGYGVGAHGPEQHHTTHDGRGSVVPQKDGVHDGIKVGRDIEDHRGDEQCPGAVQAARLAVMETIATARAAMGIAVIERAADVATHQPARQGTGFGIQFPRFGRAGHHHHAFRTRQH